MARGGKGQNPGGMLRPTYKVVKDLAGGLNVSCPPDQVGENESPDMLNLVYSMRILSVDTGFNPFGGKVLGQPQRVIQWVLSNGTTFYVLLTTRTLYTYDSNISDWVPVPTGTTANPTVTADVIGTGAATTSVAFTGTATWTSGQLVSIPTAGGGYFLGVTGGTTSPVVVSASLAAGQKLAAGAEIYPAATFTATGQLPTSYAADPTQDWLMFVNGSDPPQAFNGSICFVIPGTSAVPIDTALYIARYHGVTVLLSTVEAGVAYNYRVRRSATGNSGVWDSLNAGFDDLSDTDDAIQGAFTVNPYLVVPRRRSIVRASYYGVGYQVFYYDYGLSNAGVIGAQAWTPTKKDSLIISDSGIYQYAGDYSLTDVGDKVFNYLLNYTGDLNPLGEDLLFGLYIPNIDESWFVYPAASSAYPNKILRYNHKVGGWFPRLLDSKLAFLGAGTYVGGTSRTWNDLVGSWTVQTWSWNWRGLIQSYTSLLFCGALDNQVYDYKFFNSPTDNGAVIPWYFTTKDFVMPEDWETLDGLVFYGQGTIGTVELSLDFGVTYRVFGTNVAMGPTWSRQEIDFSLTTEFVRARFSGTDPAFKLSWFALKHMFASEA